MWYNGFLDLSAWQLVAVTLLMTHVTIIGVTVYLHRYSAHRSLELNGGLKHFFRFWLWLTTAQNTREWTAIHRKHHAKCETVDDPHSPVIKGYRPFCEKVQSCIAKKLKILKHCVFTAKIAPKTGLSEIFIRVTKCWAWRSCWSSTCCCSAPSA